MGVVGKQAFVYGKTVCLQDSGIPFQHFPWPVGLLKYGITGRIQSLRLIIVEIDSEGNPSVVKTKSNVSVERRTFYFSNFLHLIFIFIYLITLILFILTFITMKELDLLIALLLMAVLFLPYLKKKMVKLKCELSNRTFLKKQVNK